MVVEALCLDDRRECVLTSLFTSVFLMHTEFRLVISLRTHSCVSQFVGALYWEGTELGPE